MAAKRLKRKPKQARSEETVAVIVEAAAQVLLERDYTSTTTNRIAERGGVSVGSIYQYFRNKEEIFQAVLNRYTRATLEAIDQVDLSSARTVEEAVRMLVLTFHATWPNGPEMLRKLSQAPGPYFREVLDHAKTHVLVYLRAFLAARNARPQVADVDLSLKIIVDAVEGAFLNWDQEVEPERFASEVAAIAVGYLRVR